MKKSRINQIVLLLIGTILIVGTYIIYPNLKREKIQNVQQQEKIENKDISLDKVEDENVFEDVVYNGFDVNGNPFKIESKVAVIKKDEPDVTYMTDVTAIFYLENDRIVTITSKYGNYNKTNNNMFFQESVKTVEANNRLFSDNLDYLAFENYVTAYNNVKFINEEGIGFADKAVVDLNTRKAKISMYENKSPQVADEKVRVKVNLQ